MSSGKRSIRVVINTDSTLISQGLSALLGESDQIEVVGRGRDTGELDAMVGELRPDAVIISLRTSLEDLDPTAMATMDAARQLRLEYPLMSIIVISDRGNGFALDLLQGGSSRIAYLIDNQELSMEVLLGVLAELRAGRTVLDASIVDRLVSNHRSDRSHPIDSPEHFRDRPT
jgi:DNA-binding NarL/FixJ family response regulator